MHGLLKCISGRFQVRSYTACSTDSQNLDPPPSLSGKSGVIPTVPSYCLVTPASSPCFLTPAEHNFHEIRAVGDVCAVFLDILSPPYHESPSDVLIGEEARDCAYYREAVVQEDTGKRMVAWLEEASAEEVRAFRTRSEDYNGPRVGRKGNINET
jgi:hypothetical protein